MLSVLLTLLLIVGILFVIKVEEVQAAYCGGDTPCNCDDTVVSDYTLTEDLICPSIVNCGLRIGANDITIDGNGHTIKGKMKRQMYGICDYDGYNNVTIKNFGNITNWDCGIYCREDKDCENWVITNNTITSNSYAFNLGTISSNITISDYNHGKNPNLCSF